MKITETAIPDVLLFEPTVHGDSRGYFMETFRQSHFAERGIDLEFVQDNQSLSSQGTLRGLHYQLKRPQGKLVRAGAGSLFDVAVDMRRSSPTFGQWRGYTLSDSNYRQIYIPVGFAHGFCVLSETAEFLYKVSEYYSAEKEKGIMWNDRDIAIKWPTSKPILSEKDKTNPALKDI